MKLLSGLALAFVLVAGSSCTMSYGEPQAAVSQGCFRRPWRISAPPVPVSLPPTGSVDLSTGLKSTPSPAPSPIQDFPPTNLRQQPAVVGAVTNHSSNTLVFRGQGTTVYLA